MKPIPFGSESKSERSRIRGKFKYTFDVRSKINLRPIRNNTIVFKRSKTLFKNKKMAKPVGGRAAFMRKKRFDAKDKNRFGNFKKKGVCRRNGFVLRTSYGAKRRSASTPRRGTVSAASRVRQHCVGRPETATITSWIAAHRKQQHASSVYKHCYLAGEYWYRILYWQQATTVRACRGVAAFETTRTPAPFGMPSAGRTTERTDPPTAC